jgi:hypothetical protein
LLKPAPGQVLRGRKITSMSWHGGETYGKLMEHIWKSMRIQILPNIYKHPWKSIIGDHHPIWWWKYVVYHQSNIVGSNYRIRYWTQKKMNSTRQKPKCVSPLAPQVWALPILWVLLKSLLCYPIVNHWFPLIKNNQELGWQLGPIDTPKHQILGFMPLYLQYIPIIGLCPHFYWLSINLSICWETSNSHVDA